MIDDPQFSELFEALGSLKQSEGTAELVVLDSRGDDISSVIDNHIYGLLSQPTLSGPQIEVLKALLSGRPK